MEKYMKETLDYYDKNITDYIDNWKYFEYDIPDIFMSYLNKDDYILELGCGTGRDSKIFMDKGYKVKPIDGSYEMCKTASEYLGIDVEKVNFLDIDYNNEFDAIFSAAALLHLNNKDLLIVLNKISNALKDNGIFYTSFKYGNSERYDDKGRFYNDMNEDKFNDILYNYPEFELLKTWYDTNKDKFINYIVRKRIK